MPIYEYECKSCGERFELLRSISSSDDDIKCKACSSEQVERLFSAFASNSTTFGGGSSGGCVPRGGFT